MSGIVQGEHVAQQFALRFTTLYRALGEGHQSITGDELLIAFHTAARRFGDVAERFSSLAPRRAGVTWEPAPSNDVLYDVVRDALTADSSGQLATYVLCVHVLPALLVALRDVPSVASLTADRPLLERAHDAASTVVSVLMALGDVARRGTSRLDVDATTAFSARVDDPTFAALFSFVTR